MLGYVLALFADLAAPLCLATPLSPHWDDIVDMIVKYLWTSIPDRWKCHPPVGTIDGRRLSRSINIEKL